MVLFDPCFFFKLGNCLSSKRDPRSKAGGLEDAPDLEPLSNKDLLEKLQSSFLASLSRIEILQQEGPLPSPSTYCCPTTASMPRLLELIVGVLANAVRPRLFMQS